MQHPRTWCHPNGFRTIWPETKPRRTLGRQTKWQRIGRIIHTRQAGMAGILRDLLICLRRRRYDRELNADWDGGCWDDCSPWASGVWHMVGHILAVQTCAYKIWGKGVLKSRLMKTYCWGLHISRNEQSACQKQANENFRAILWQIEQNMYEKKINIFSI